MMSGKNKSFLTLFFPILLIAFSGCFYLMVEKALLGNFSTFAMEAALSVAYIGQIFQLSTVAIVMMCQVFIGQQYGERNWKAMGPHVWQFIWFAILSTFVVYPVGITYGALYLKGMPFEQIAFSYLHFILLINFLHPLGIALSCFYIAQGKTYLVFFSSITAQLVKLLLAYLLIPKLVQINPLWGLYGGGVSTFLAQSLFVLVLFFGFMKSKNADLCDSRNFLFRPKLFWKCVKPGLLRGLNRILGTICWASIAHLMSVKTEMHLLVFSIGGVVFLFLPFLSDAICQAQTVIVSRLIGERNYAGLLEAFRPALICASVSIFLCSFPMVLFPEKTFAILFPNIHLDAHVIRLVSLGLWIDFAFFTLAYIPIGYILAFKDMVFSAGMGLFQWINGFLFMYILIEKIDIASEWFWIGLGFMFVSNALIYFCRSRSLCYRALEPAY